MYRDVPRIAVGGGNVTTDLDVILLNRLTYDHPFIFNYLHQVFIPLHGCAFNLYVQVLRILFATLMPDLTFVYPL